jgi:hypothetical protein
MSWHLVGVDPAGSGAVSAVPGQDHRSLVVPVRDGRLSEAEKRVAAEHRDVRIP